jgi:putative spermidine/putrescine transport system substrate-binding protein
MNTDTRPTPRSRRRSLPGLSALLAATLILVACSPTPAAPPATTASPAAPAATAPATAAPATAASADKGPLVFVSWGGSYQDCLREAYLTPWSQKTGIEVIDTGPTDYGKFKAMVESGNVEWDVVDVDADFTIDAQKQGLLEELDYSVIDSNGFIQPERTVTPYGAPVLFWSKVLVYNTKTFTGEQPKTWADLWDLKRFPGKRAFWRNVGSGSALEAALLADGVPADQLYPLDVDRALKKLDEIKSEILWYDTGAQQMAFWENGEAVLGMGWDGRVYDLIEKGAPMGIELNNAFLAWDHLVIPTGSKHKDLAMQLIAYATTPEAQAKFSECIVYSPTRAKAFDFVSPERAKLLTTAPEHVEQAIAVDYEWWATNRQSVTEQFEAWLLK